MDADEPWHLKPAESWDGRPVIAIHRYADGSVSTEYSVRYPDGRSSSASSDHRTTESVSELLAIFDAMQDSHRAAARARAEGERGAGGLAESVRPAPTVVGTQPTSSPTQSRCAENVRRGSTVTQCSRKATRGLYCAQHYRSSTVDSFESAPAGLEDAPDTLPW